MDIKCEQDKLSDKVFQHLFFVTTKTMTMVTDVPANHVHVQKQRGKGTNTTKKLIRNTTISVKFVDDKS